MSFSSFLSTNWKKKIATNAYIMGERRELRKRHRPGDSAPKQLQAMKMKMEKRQQQVQIQVHVHDGLGQGSNPEVENVIELLPKQETYKDTFTSVFSESSLFEVEIEKSYRNVQQIKQSHDDSTCSDSDVGTTCTKTDKVTKANLPVWCSDPFRLGQIKRKLATFVKDDTGKYIEANENHRNDPEMLFVQVHVFGPKDVTNGTNIEYVELSKLNVFNPKSLLKCVKQAVTATAAIGTKKNNKQKKMDKATHRYPALSKWIEMYINEYIKPHVLVDPEKENLDELDYQVQVLSCCRKQTDSATIEQLGKNIVEIMSQLPCVQLEKTFQTLIKQSRSENIPQQVNDTTLASKVEPAHACDVQSALADYLSKYRCWMPKATQTHTDLTEIDSLWMQFGQCYDEFCRNETEIWTEASSKTSKSVLKLAEKFGKFQEDSVQDRYEWVQCLKKNENVLLQAKIKIKELQCLWSQHCEDELKFRILSEVANSFGDFGEEALERIRKAETALTALANSFLKPDSNYQ